MRAALRIQGYEIFRDCRTWYQYYTELIDMPCIIFYQLGKCCR